MTKEIEQGDMVVYIKNDTIKIGEVTYVSHTLYSGYRSIEVDDRSIDRSKIAHTVGELAVSMGITLSFI